MIRLKIEHGLKYREISEVTGLSVSNVGRAFSAADRDFQFAAAVASFGMLLRNSQYKGDATYASVLEIASPAAAGDESGYRREFLDLVRTAGRLSGAGGR